MAEEELFVKPLEGKSQPLYKLEDMCGRKGYFLTKQAMEDAKVRYAAETTQWFVTWLRQSSDFVIDKNEKDQYISAKDPSSKWGDTSNVSHDCPTKHINEVFAWMQAKCPDADAAYYTSLCYPSRFDYTELVIHT